MRAEFAQALVERAATSRDLVLITGDLGFMALEKVREALGPRFINAGVAEQNMMTVAAGMAQRGLVPIVYSIAPFAVLRPLEQFRNDACLHHLPVKVVGNGGGYGYGIMGATHHAIEDVAVMRAMPDAKVLVPVFGNDVAAAVDVMLNSSGPTYLRLNSAPKITTPMPAFAPWRQLQEGTRAVVVGMGPVVANVFGDAAPAGALEVWGVGELPLAPLPEALLRSLMSTRRLLIIEEHRAAGGLGEALALALLSRLDTKLAMRHACAGGYPSKAYGSQRWHLEDNALAGAPLRRTIEELLNEGGDGRAG